jgi:hypothetical protein
MLPLPFEVKVVWVSRHQDNVVLTNVGDPIEVRAEPTNEFDSNALVVNSRGRRLGYIPAAVAKRLATEGINELSGVVVERGGSVVQGVRILLEQATTSFPSVNAHSLAPVAREDRQNVSVRGSGRVLGTLLIHDLERGRVVVESERGRVEYNDSLVVIGERVGP